MNPTLVRLMLSGWVFLAFYIYAKRYLLTTLLYHSQLIPAASVTVGMLFAIWQPALSDHRLVRAIQSVGIIVLGYQLIAIMTRRWPPFAVFDGGGFESLPILAGLFFPAIFAVVVVLPLAFFSAGNGRERGARPLDPAGPLPPATRPGSVPPASSGSP